MSTTSTAIAKQPIVSQVETRAALEWYAIRTRSRHERVVERQLQGQEIEVFYPVTSQMHLWNDRRKLVESPLFPGYVFVHIAPRPEDRVRVLRIHGVVQLVGKPGEGTPIPSEQMEAVQALLTSNTPFTQHAFLKVGQRVRVRGGSLNGVEGILVAQNGSRNLVISVAPIERSLSIRVEGYEVEPL